VLDLNELITNLLKMLRRLIGENIELEFHHPSTVSLVEADSSMLEQVLMNLTVNARDAMPKGGRITLATEMVEVAASQSRRNPDARPGRFFCLSVADTGCGMNEATLNRVFEPFFTTKEAGKGTGLGLATVHGIVKQHRGWIEVESAVGKGTTFRVWLPPATREEEPTSGEGVRALPKGGRETILVVEDDPSVRQVAAVYLRRGGYAVLEADKPSEALRQWEQHGKKVALLLTDVVLPEGMTGMELAEKLRAEQPNLKIILSSGYATELVGRDWRTAKDVTYLPKPWVPARLAEVVREVLDREP
jgi:CheY-like chemotaxis protein